MLASRALFDRQRELYRDLLKISQAAVDVAGLGRKYHGTSSEMLWDILQLVGQTDLLVREAKEAKMEEYLTPSFKATLKASVKDSETRRSRDTKDAFLHPKLDALVSDASKTDGKVGLTHIQWIVVDSFYLQMAKVVKGHGSDRAGGSGSGRQGSSSTSYNAGRKAWKRKSSRHDEDKPRYFRLRTLRKRVVQVIATVHYQIRMMMMIMIMIMTLIEV